MNTNERSTNIKEKEIRPMNGIIAMLLITLLTAAAFAIMLWGAFKMDAQIYSIGVPTFIVGLVGLCLFPILYAGLKVVQPNEARVLTLFGKYHGTIKKAGYYYVNPFCVSVAPILQANETTTTAKKSASSLNVNLATGSGAKKNISLKTQTLNNDRQKVNDVLGNPIVIGAIVIWRVSDPTKAVFAVENYKEYLSIQTDSIIRNTARLYPYDIFEEDDDADGVKEKSLRGSSLEIAENMKSELQAKVCDAGLLIEEVRITHLAYSEEIAAAMLQRQQAAAIIAARQKIVDGAVGMVKMAIDKLGEDEIVVLDEERKAAMVSNLLVVLCGNKDAQPIVNSGSIY